MSSIEVEFLQKLSYDRSKHWASFLDNFSTKEDNLEEIAFSNFDDFYSKNIDRNESSDDLASMEDDVFDESTVNPEVLKNGTNTTWFSSFFNNKTLGLSESNNCDEQNEFIDIFNQTMPIISEHNRQLKESGLDRILNTFDKKKIEDKVGSWLNHHNSLFGGDNILQSDDANCKKDRKVTLRAQYEASPDSDDSFQSGETARYIRSSKAGTVKHSSSTNTIIKTYRMVNSARESRHKKYACEKDDDYHFKAIHHRRKMVHEQEYHHKHYDLPLLKSSRKYEKQQLSSQKQRRKVLRKRICSNSCSTMNSSDSDCSYECNRRFHREMLETCCNNYHCSAAKYNYPVLTASTNRIQRCAIKMTSAPRNRMYYHSHSRTKSLSTSSSSASFSSACERRRITKRNSNFYNDNRPCKRESECHCRNEKKLCEEYKHVANSSTEEWYVENYCSPKKLLKNASCHLKSTALIGNVTDEYSTAERNLKAISFKDSEKKIQLKNEKTSKMKCKILITRNAFKDAISKEDAAGSELQLPKKTSKPALNENLTEEVFNAERNLKANSFKGPPKKIQLNSEKTFQMKSKMSTTKDDFQYSTSEEDEFDRELQMAIKESKELYEKQQKLMLDKEKEPKNEILSPQPLANTSNMQEEFVNQKPTRRKTPATENKKVCSKKVTKKLPKLVEDENNEDTEDVSSSSFTSKSPTKKICTTKTKNCVLNIKEGSFFTATPSQAIYNSTALSSKGQAYNRQISDKLGKQEDEEEHSKSFRRKNPYIKKSIATKKKKVASSAVSQEKKNAASTTVTSTTIRSPEINCCTLTSSDNEKNPTKEEDEMNYEDNSDCSLVTSTTNIELPLSRTINKQVGDAQKQQASSTSKSNHQMTQMGILLYAPENRSMVPAYCFTSDGYFTITKEHLSSVIGEKKAKKFLKYYIGRKRFSSNSTVYYRPPASGTLIDNETSSSDSADDLDNLGQYGDLYESLDKTIKKN